MVNEVDVNEVKYVNEVDVNYTRLNENLQVVLFSVVSFFLPYFLSHPQVLVGAVVNMMLILGAQNVKGHKMWPVILLPSLGVLTSGMLFGSFTFYLVYFIPLIWASNAILVFGYKYFRFKRRQNVLLSVSPAIVLKVLLLTVYATVLVSLGVVPDKFMMAMSGLQLGTAIIGAVLATGTTHFILRKLKSNKNGVQ